MASAKGKVVVSAEVPEALREATDERARAEGRSRSEVISRALRFYMKWAPVVPADEEPPDPLPAGDRSQLAPEPEPPAPKRRGKK